MRGHKGLTLEDKVRGYNGLMLEDRAGEGLELDRVLLLLI